jgi:hypothetical protein
MTNFIVYTADSAPQSAKQGLKAAKASFGFIPNLQATMAESPSYLLAIRFFGISSRRPR